MTPDKYQRVKEIFLAACDKPLAERDRFIRHSAGEDAEIQREVESLLREHTRDTQVMPDNPESPIGSMSAILSRAHLDQNNVNDRDAAAVEDAARSQLPKEGERRGGGDFLDESNPSSGSNSGFVDAGRFMAGTIATGRYRIIELLGRGGMGEVYRADDITLNQSVALKFLPALFGQDKNWLDRFHNEVRLARQVTHPNVCRVFDIGEFQGEQFISMEYIDGENLASLLRRIGRLPHDKGLQIARQLCAGLSAAHDRGVLHRDLKPANVMIDGRGSVRITDFGLAAPADQLRKDALRAGTPAYMSPEQLAGRGVSVRSDVYSVGLVLYEMFTGKRAFRGDSLRDYQKLHSTELPTPPSEIVHDIDPIVDRVIMRCLEKDPKNRPSSAMAVSAALPGGDPLRAILAAGETPSPEVVAAAGETHRGLTPRLATLFLVAGILCLLLVGILAPKTFVVQKAIRDNPPVVLAHGAREILKSLGYEQTPVDSAYGFAVNEAYYHQIENGPPSIDRIGLLARPHLGLVSFWYRQSTTSLVPWRPDRAVTADDPPNDRPGMVLVSVDPAGRLTGLEAQDVGPDPLPVATAPSPDKLPRTDWAPLLKAAEIDVGHFREMPSTQVPPVYTDQRAAWEGYFADGLEEKIHVEAGSFHGKVVYFSIADGWSDGGSSQSLSLIIQTLVTVFLIVAGGIMALNNYRSGRGDKLGAVRISLAFFLLGAVAWLFRTHHVPDIVMELRMFSQAMGTVIYSAALVWIFYLALESYVRRVWPETIISWSRLLTGRWIDPLVGRDVLIGSVVGIVITLLNTLGRIAPPLVGLPAPMPNMNASMEMLESATNFSTLFSGAVNAIYVGLLLLLFLVVMRLVLKRKSLAAIAFVAIFLAASPQAGAHDYFSYIIQAATAVLFLAVMVRNGLVAIIFCAVTRMLLTDFPVTFDFSVWYRASAFCGIGVTLLVLVVATYAALGGRPLITLRLAERT